MIARQALVEIVFGNGTTDEVRSGGVLCDLKRQDVSKVGVERELMRRRDVHYTRREGRERELGRRISEK
jgi:hypothetical protein